MAITTWAAGDQANASAVNTNFTDTILGLPAYAADAGATDAYAVTLAPAPTAYTTGMRVFFKANTVNTGASTLNVNALGAKSIYKNVSEDLSDNDIKASQIVSVIYDGTSFQLLSFPSNPARFKTGQGTRTSAEGIGNETIAHGLGAIPKLIKITFSAYRSSTQITLSWGVGTATSTSDESCTYSIDLGSSSGGWKTDQHATAIIHTEHTGGVTGWEATLTTLDSTNIVLNFGTASDHTLFYQWEAYS